jgi:hypothetical protein
LYVLIGHFLHNFVAGLPPALSLVNPALQIQSEAASLPVVEFEFAVQLVQTLEAEAAEYLPAPQSAQVEATLAPTASENLPAVQLAQTVEASAAEYVPAPQSMHVAATEAPEVVEYVPAPQSVQTVKASAAEYLPATQSMHAAATEAPEVVEYLPAPQSPQSVALVLASEPENLPAAQSVHAVCAASRYFPAAQAAHETHVPFDSVLSAISDG